VLDAEVAAAAVRWECTAAPPPTMAATHASPTINAMPVVSAPEDRFVAAAAGRSGVVSDVCAIGTSGRTEGACACGRFVVCAESSVHGVFEPFSANSV